MAYKLMTNLSIFFMLAYLTFAAVSSSARAQNIEVKSYAGISYMSGGVGLGEREQMESMGQSYNLKLVFAVQQGNYLTDVRVTITNSSGSTLLDAVSDGPWFYVKLPAGTYNVAATTMDKTLRKVAQVGAGSRAQLNFVWAK